MHHDGRPILLEVKRSERRAVDGLEDDLDISARNSPMFFQSPFGMN